MKPFNLDLAKAGHPVCTKEGNPVRIICFDRKSDAYPIIALVNSHNHEYCLKYTIQGYCDTGCGNDLCMASVKKEGWINIYKQDGKERRGGLIYSSRNEAERASALNCIDIVKIEWEE